MTLVINKRDVVGSMWKNKAGQKCPMAHFVTAIGLDSLDPDFHTIMPNTYNLPSRLRSDIYDAAATYDYPTLTRLFALAGHTVTFVD